VEVRWGVHAARRLWRSRRSHEAHLDANAAPRRVIALFLYVLLFNLSNAPLFLFVFRHQQAHVKLPRNIEDTKALRDVLLSYRDDYYYHVVFLYCAIYIL
jgi:hypothetical protein